MLGALGLGDGAAQLTFAGAVGLIPLAVVHRDESALDLDGGEAAAGPQDQDVDLVFGPSLPYLHRVGQYDVVRQLGTQGVPKCLFSQLAVLKVWLFRYAVHDSP